MSLNGIDISMHQAGINLAVVKSDFVVMKATEGTGYKDPQFENFMSQAIQAKKKIGIYHFCRNDLGNTAIAEADWFLEVAGQYAGKAILILDWESSRASDVAYAKAWLDRVRDRTGYLPMIYMNQYTENNNNWSSVASANYGLWGAKYRDNSPDYNYDMSNAGTPFSSKYWRVVAMWQWTSTGRLNGYNGNLDCDLFYGDYETWDKYAGGPAPQPPQPKPEPTTKYKVGTLVCTNTLATASTGGTVYKGDWTGTITNVIPGRPYPYLLNNGTGWTNDVGIDTDPHFPGQSIPAPTIVVGSIVRIRNGASDYNGTKLANFVYGNAYTVQEIRGTRVVLQEIQTAVNIKDLILV